MRICKLKILNNICSPTFLKCWDKWTCFYAAKGGHLEVLKYLHENGYSLDKEFCIKEARNNGHEDVLRYLQDVE